MPFISQHYRDFLTPEARQWLEERHSRIGIQPETRDVLYIPEEDRFSSQYVIGLPGNGKSGLLHRQIHNDAERGQAVIVIDPHGDLINAVIASLPAHRLLDIYLIDLEDAELYPFGASLFDVGALTTNLAKNRAVDKLMQIFGRLSPEVLTQQYLPLYLPNIIRVFLDNPGTTLVDVMPFLRSSQVRSKMLKEVSDQSLRDFWETEYDSLPEREREQRLRPLFTRLHTLFTGRSTIRNILGRRSTIDFRRAIEEKQILLIRLPLKVAPMDATLVGTVLLNQIQNAIFSFGDVPPDQRKGVSLYVDEVQNFSSPDFSLLLTEARKFSARTIIAHQYRSQLPGYLQDATMAARTVVCFQLTPEDGRELAHLFPCSETTVKPEDIEVHPVQHLLTYGTDNPQVRTFIDTYLLPLQHQKRGHRVEINHYSFDWVNNEVRDKPKLPDPTPYLDNLLYAAMKGGDPYLPIPPLAVQGFANCGRGFYGQAMSLSPRDQCLSASVCFPPALVVEGAGGSLIWTRAPESSVEQLFHFIFHLRMTMEHLVEHPIGKATTTSTSDVAQWMTRLPRRAAFVRAGDTTGVIYTDDMPEGISGQALYDRIMEILVRTRQRYCTPRVELEQPAEKPEDEPFNRWEEA